MRSMTRRDFLHDSTALAGALGAASLTAPWAVARAKKADANDRLNVAVIGVNGRGMDHVQGMLNPSLNCAITTICDCDEAVIGRAMKKVEDKQGKPPAYVKDLRKVFDDKSIDLVTIATPNHWHSLAGIWAMQSGKHVYVEKPVSHNVREGRVLVDTARKYNRICQAGTQSRTQAGMREAIEFLHAGKLGKIKLARGLCYKPRLSIGKVEGEGKIPASVDYDIWCGPSPKAPLRRKKLHYDWHWVWATGNGDLGNQGIHQMDIARWGLGKAGLASSCVSLGGRVGYADDGETANTQLAMFDYGDCELIFEVRGLPTSDLKGAKIGNIFYGSDGYLVLTSYSTGTAFTTSGEVIRKFNGGGDHYGNFVKAVRSGKKDDLNGDILEGHVSSALCHLANISYQLGAPAGLGDDAKKLHDDTAAVESIGRLEEHLKLNKVSADDPGLKFGRKLTIDPKAERFVNDDEANAHLTRAYREGYAVPEQA